MFLYTIVVIIIVGIDGLAFFFLPNRSSLVVKNPGPLDTANETIITNLSPSYYDQIIVPDVYGDHDNISITADWSTVVSKVPPFSNFKNRSNRRKKIIKKFKQNHNKTINNGVCMNGKSRISHHIMLIGLCIAILFFISISFLSGFE